MTSVAASPGRVLPRLLSGTDVATVLVAITIGAGIYSTPQVIAQNLGDLRVVLLCWIGGGVFAFLGAMVYAEVGTRIPDTGGEYLYLRRLFGPWAGFLCAWLEFFLVAPTGRVSLALVTAAYLAPAADAGAVALLAAAIIVVLCAVNYVGVRWSLGLQRALVVSKVAGLVVLAGGAFWLGGAVAPGLDAGSTAPVTARGFATATFLVLFSYLGWNRVAPIVGEVRNPARALPAGLLAGTAIVVALYLATIQGYYRVLGADGVAAAPGVAAATAQRLFGGMGAFLVTAMVVVSTLGSMTGSILAHSRMSFAASRDGLFLPGLDFVHPRFLTPSRAVAAHALACLALLALRQDLAMVMSSMVFGRLLFLAMVGLSLYRLRREGSSGSGTYRMPGYPVLPAVFLGCVALLVVARLWIQPRESLVDLAILVGALPLLPLTRWLNRRASRPSAG